MLDRNSFIPLYCQLADEIQRQIISGEIKPGDKLPSESEMMKIYDIGRPTVRQALSQLVHQGYLSKEHGRGTFCRNNNIRKNMMNIDVILDMEDTYFIISDSKNSTDEICTILRNIYEKGTSGVILQPSHSNEEIPPALEECFRMYRHAGIPYIMIDCTYNIRDSSYVMLDEYRGGYMAAQYLHNLGHKKILLYYVNGYTDSIQRKDGFCAACHEFSLPQPTLLSYEYDVGIKESILLQCLHEQKISGIFCYNDYIAVECIHLLQKNGIRVPEDVSVIGFDDSILASTALPPLTTIAHPKQQLGTLAAEILLKQIDKKQSSPYIKVFDPILVERKSCRCINAVSSCLNT